MDKKFLKPGKEGLLVRDPITKRPLNPEGEEKQITSYWARRISCGDAVVVDQPVAEESQENKSSAN